MVILHASLGSRLTLTVARSRRTLAYLVPEDFLLSPAPRRGTAGGTQKVDQSPAHHCKLSLLPRG